MQGPQTIKNEVMEIEAHVQRLRAIRADLAEETEAPDLCRCEAEFAGECSRCNAEDEQEALGERDGEMADDFARFGC